MWILRYIYLLSLALTLLFSLTAFLLSTVVKKRGVPTGKSQKKIAVVFISVLLAAFLFVLPYNKAEEYFSVYPVWFQENSGKICEEEEEIYNSITYDTSYEKAVKELNSNGYTDVDTYISSLDKGDRKKLRYNIKKLNLDIDEDAVIFFNKEYIEKNISQFKKDGNRLIVLKKGSDGKVCEKAIGYLSSMKNEYGGFGVYGSREDDYKKCLSDFDLIKKGESKESITSKYGKEYGEIYRKSVKYTEKGCEEYFRYYINGYTDDDISDTSIYVEFTFLNSKLTEGNLYYMDFSQIELQQKSISVNNSWQPVKICYTVLRLIFSLRKYGRGM